MRTRKICSVLIFFLLASHKTAHSQTHDVNTSRINIMMAMLEEMQRNQVPVGTVVAFSGTQAPEGWLLCDGSAKSREQFARLFDVIGYTHGGSGGSFNVPDYRGRFLRGVDGGTGRDPDASARTAMSAGGASGNQVGSVQSSAFEKHRHDGSSVGKMDGNTSHSHGYQSFAWTSVQKVNAATFWPTPVYPSYVDKKTDSVNIDHSHSLTIRESGTSSETRPSNAYVNYIIKY
jgi:microcystin-dependent protein